MSRVYNFSAGPAVLPEPVLKKAAAELLEYRGTGMSVMEMSHRSKAYDDIIQTAEALLRDLMNIPDNYKVLFLQGGASSQFAMVPLNLMRKTRKVDIVHTGTWTKRALDEIKRYGTCNIIASSEDKNFSYIPKPDRVSFSSDADYFHICTNNTIEGTRYTSYPDTGSVPLVADMSSNILSEVVNVSRFGIIFAGAQKNIGPAGLTIVIIREDLIGHAMDITPTMFNYKTHADNKSLYNTPPTYGIYIAKLVFEWLKDLGGVPAMQKINEEKAKILYDCLDNSSIFKSPIAREDRSLMNIPFTAATKDLEARFLTEAGNNGFVQLEGHRSVGGMRASIYNAMPIEGVKKLVDFMKKFEADNK
ncbi:MAG TPA: 3-phosphoserine/phosphohydroxythreonine transaminase [Spirochaetota bacterium]|nr:3-phosphoserine/phosphohydroxythreonine transaminase [Spirochaetota bacterium]HPC39532.1 3-phosphoserine/phosphohydroxythreonine transaminase [Spirochaetota bacterium]HPL15250.1 3-phosphoserine/phosphohydroxythreonine transaminase [Spirochaetota bacterium]HQF06869.1 3-phosphoserine/phosphohydroxythreonine transaminase [Spirochaetota bacterium]HQH95512.1 3-phosphoserine/phosphohydroxythreonine transaminase [Spirochaetota bacterium]